jgi:hypothetical protein
VPGSPSSARSPRPVVALPWGSRSTIRTLRTELARALPPSETVVVVFPTPPFWFATQSTVAGPTSATSGRQPECTFVCPAASPLLSSHPVVGVPTSRAGSDPASLAGGGSGGPCEVSSATGRVSSERSVCRASEARRGAAEEGVREDPADRRAAPSGKVHPHRQATSLRSQRRRPIITTRGHASDPGPSRCGRSSGVARTRAPVRRRAWVASSNSSRHRSPFTA